MRKPMQQISVLTQGRGTMCLVQIVGMTVTMGSGLVPSYQRDQRRHQKRRTKGNHQNLLHFHIKSSRVWEHIYKCHQKEGPFISCR